MATSVFCLKISSGISHSSGNAKTTSFDKVREVNKVILCVRNTYAFVFCIEEQH